MSAFGNALAVSIRRRPELTRLLFGLLRRVRPVLILGKSVVLLRADEVREVLERASDFELGPVGERKMLMGPFLLGMDPRQQYHDERKLLGDILESLGAQVDKLALEECGRARNALAQRLAPGGGSTRIDVVSDYAEPVVTRIASRLYGVPFPQDAHSRVVRARNGEELLAQWLRKVGSVIATSWPAPFGLERVASACARELRAHLEREIELRRPTVARGEVGDDVLGRLLASDAGNGWGPARVLSNLAGLMLAGSSALVMAFTQTLDQLLRRRRELARAIDVARSAGPGDPRLRAAVFEALRFHPTFPILVRHCPRATTLGVGERSRTIPAGSSVYAVLLSAMFDDEVEDADAFGWSRPDHQVLHFGAGSHECLGRSVATTELVEMVRAFLTLPGLEGAEAGRIRFDGPAVHRFPIEIRAPSAGERSGP